MTTEPNAQTDAQTQALTRREASEREIREGIGGGVGPMAMIPTSFLEMQSFAEVLSKSDLVPKHYQGKPANTFLAIQMGAELGFSPATSLRMFDVIEGLVGLKSKAMTAVVNRSPLCEYLEPAEGNDGKSATWITKRRGRPERRATWTIEMAQTAGLLGKDNWKKYPHRMLSARAKKDLCDDVYPEVVGGLMTSDEILDMIESEPGKFEAPPAPEPPKSKSKSKAKDVEPEKKEPDAIDAEFTEKAKTETAAPTNGGLPPDKARDDAFAKAAANARALDEERAKKAAASAAAEAESSGNAGKTKVEPTPEPKLAVVPPPSDDDFGDSTPARTETPGPTEGATPEANLKIYGVALKQAKGQLDLDAIKAIWVPWSKSDKPGFPVADQLRSMYAARKAELGL